MNCKPASLHSSISLHSDFIMHVSWRERMGSIETFPEGASWNAFPYISIRVIFGHLNVHLHSSHFWNYGLLAIQRYNEHKNWTSFTYKNSYRKMTLKYLFRPLLKIGSIDPTACFNWPSLWGQLKQLQRCFVKLILIWRNSWKLILNSSLGSQNNVVFRLIMHFTINKVGDAAHGQM